MEDTDAPLRYRVLTGPDDAEFCRRVSAALDQGYRLHGAPALTCNGGRVIVAQALVLDDEPETSGLVSLAGRTWRPGPLMSR